MHNPKIYPNGTKEWYINGKRHRIDGPAVEYNDGTKAWFINDNLHRTDGPAIEYPDGTKEWFINGNQYQFNDWIKQINIPYEDKIIIGLIYA